MKTSAPMPPITPSNSARSMSPFTIQRTRRACHYKPFNKPVDRAGWRRVRLRSYTQPAPSDACGFQRDPATPGIALDTVPPHVAYWHAMKTLTSLALDPGTAAAVTSFDWLRKIGELDLKEGAEILQGVTQALREPNSAEAVQLLATQAMALNSLFHALARRAAHAPSITEVETLLRLALKAQSQSCATVETLGAVTAPRVVFAQQANIAAGHQQICNASPEAQALPPPSAQQPRFDRAVGIRAKRTIREPP